MGHTKKHIYRKSNYKNRFIDKKGITKIIILFSRTHMFGVPGQHTFFLPVDSAFDVSVQLTGYDYERGRPTGLNKMGVSHFNL